MSPATLNKCVNASVESTLNHYGRQLCVYGGPMGGSHTRSCRTSLMQGTRYKCYGTRQFSIVPVNHDAKYDRLLRVFHR